MESKSGMFMLMAAASATSSFAMMPARLGRSAASGIGRSFGRAFRRETRGSYWKPGPEHLPTGPESRQVRRRREQLERRKHGRRGPNWVSRIAADANEREVEKLKRVHAG